MHGIANVSHGNGCILLGVFDAFIHLHHTNLPTAFDNVEQIQKSCGLSGIFYGNIDRVNTESIHRQPTHSSYLDLSRLHI